ncbi:MAG: hypothetical protein FWG38_10680 [Defluviitaleaceae bacterium]|nr:hypothetical protein [Defluviitaleaceae bacterium]
MENTAKNTLLRLINQVAPLVDYQPNDHIFSEKYRLSATDMVYLLQQLSKDYGIIIDDALVDSLEMGTFAQLEDLLVTPA